MVRNNVRFYNLIPDAIFVIRDRITIPNRRFTITHEIGHALGLLHTPTTIPGAAVFFFVTGGSSLLTALVAYSDCIAGAPPLATGYAILPPILGLTEELPDEVRLELYNPQNAKLKTVRSKKKVNRFAVEHLTPGIYVLHIHYRGKVYEEKVAIKTE